MSRKLISSDEGVESETQHTKACSDCPWRRDSLPGWLGGLSVEEWLHRAHTDTYVPCHVVTNQQCAGLAIYRRNTCKSVRPPLLTLPADRELCLSNRLEFEAHHAP